MKFLPLSLASFSSNLNCQSLVYFTSMLLEHRTFFKLPLVEEVPRNLQVNYLPKQYLDTIKRVFYCGGRLASETRNVVSL